VIFFYLIRVPFDGELKYIVAILNLFPVPRPLGKKRKLGEEDGKNRDVVEKLFRRSGCDSRKMLGRYGGTSTHHVLKQQQLLLTINFAGIGNIWPS
jgi:hypothetical protein